MIIFACLLITFGVFFYIFYIGEVETGPEKDRLAYLAERKEVVYENLRDLNFEYKAGKLSDTDYSSLKNSLEAEAAAILAEMAQLQKMLPAARQKKGVRV